MSIHLTSRRRQEDAGYFRIGHIILSIPPEEISVARIVNNQEVSPLRSRYARYLKTGHSRCDVTIRWKALCDYEQGDFQDWEDVRQIVAIFHAAPFVEVESGHLREIICREDPSFAPTDRMAFALRQFRIDTVADIVDGLQCSLTMSWFNYRPFSSDFGYVGKADASVSAYESAQFQSYIARWVKENLTTPLARKSDPLLRDWAEQNPGETRFSWRRYVAVPVDAQDVPEVHEPPVRVQSRANQLPRSNRQPVDPPAPIRKIIEQAARETGCDLNLALAICQQESNYNPHAKNPGSSASGLYQLTTGAAREMGVSNVFDPLQNALGGLGYVMKYARKYGSIDLGLVSFKSGPGVAQRGGLEAAILSDGEFPVWYRNVKSVWEKRNGSAAQTISTSAAQSSEVAKARKEVQPQIAAEGAAINALIAAGWTRDHRTGNKVFLYRENTLSLNDHEHSVLPNEARLFTAGISVVFANNLAAIPLKNFQIPTYQSIGPAGSMISISMLSNGVMAGDEEPSHPGAAKLTGMVTFLEDQYHQLKGEFRSVSSVHRMQAVTIENQVLNMLGIFNVIPQGVDTSTVPESPSMLEVRLSCSQYENSYEVLSPYKVKGTAEYDRVFEEQVISGGLLDRFPPDDPVVGPVRKFVDARSRRDTAELFRFLTDAEASPTPVAMNVKMSKESSQILRNSLGGSFESDFPKQAEKIKRDADLDFNDYILLTNNPGAPPAVRGIKKRYDALILAQSKSGSFDPVALLYDQLFRHRRENTRSFSAAMQQVMSMPGIADKLSAAVPGEGPASEQFNRDHGAYKDLGLTDLNSSPADYFVNHNADIRRQLNGYSAKAADLTVRTAQYFNSRLTSGESRPDISSSDGVTTGDAADNVAMMLSRSVIPVGTMSRAFPTYKLFLIEEDNKGLFYMFDDFYSYSNVLNMEISRHQDGARDVAVLQITNIANLLTHKLYDGSSEGKLEWSYKNQIAVPDTSTGEALTGTMAGAVQASEGVGGMNSMDLSPGLDNSGRKVNLQYFALQTGTKIQIRVGYSNNPDKLHPVFSGIVINITEGEVMTLTCQGFAAELTYPTPDDIDYNGYNIAWLGDAAGKVGAAARELATGHPVDAAGLVMGSLGRGPAYGGFAVMGEAGDAPSVIQSMLKVSTAVHFGHWQVATTAESILKGFTFTRLLAQAAPKKAGALLASAYDRSGENIYVSKRRTYQGGAQDSHLRRDYQIEMPLNLIPASYYVPKDPAINPWRIIQDVKRRYPEFIVAVKPYGFPYGCDATLVFAHPNDYYFGRMPLLGESEALRTAPEDDKYFRQWWDSRGYRSFQGLVDSSDDWCSPTLAQLRGTDFRIAPYFASRQSSAAKLRQMIVSSQDGFTQLRQIVNAAIEVVKDTEARALYGITAIVTLGLTREYNHARLENLRKDLVGFLQEAVMQVNILRNTDKGLSTEPKPNDRVQPVRKWHVITSLNIIHNGIELNHQTYNAVRVDDRSWAANSGIETVKAHMKLLDVDQLVIDPVNNIRYPRLHRAYSASFLKEELGKMYRGELVLSGIPEIEPYDVLQIWDPSLGISGPVEVESVVHSFDQELGFISIVRPRALVSVNEAFTAGLWHAFTTMNESVIGELRDATGTFMNLPGTEQAEIGLGVTGVGVGAYVGVNALAGASSAVGAAAFTATGPLAALVAGTALAGGYMYFATKRQDLNPMLIAPLVRYGHPWVAGIEGWAMNDLHTWAKQRWQVLSAYEIQPTLAGLRELLGLSREFLG